MPALIFDLDQTLIDSRIAEKYRKDRNWTSAYRCIKNFVLYGGLPELLQYAKEKGFKICIVTNSPSSYCNKVLSHWVIQYDYTVCFHDVHYRKPHPEPMLQAIKKLGEHPSNILSLGDDAKDIISSRDAGIATIGCLWGVSSDERPKLIASSPTFLVENPLEALSLIQERFFS